ncbi:protein-methionine-sulfoxide reductase catalytic subunit MsrP [Pusillimonas sp. NJUB218]|uniref:protein-methionine-sulfoxide reductase catalytic subunit MsrP n=1 Tax=Pusillimonas sp. NJUB218 TaxID=2023230 RepID=UPI000F4BC8F8|nr:protein-methionine-sulfoxide reductase catalytic subunit MsrP [Pusillimonas sp. NJUB218]ROT44638.1 mononuclear molybdenum enzyme YedY [Pusillimonas sp. NJUB218]
MSKFKIPVVPSSEITPESVWRARREWLKKAGGLALPALAGSALPGLALAAPQWGKRNPDYAVDAELTSETAVTTYNNFYEFGTGKGDPDARGGAFKSAPWTLTVEGEVLRPKTFDLDALMALAPLEERVYRLRCVEGWSMVIPWNGYSLSALLKQVEPTGNAKYVEFVTVVQPETMPGLADRIIDWPYVEALRLDEAMNPLSMLVFGVYGKALPTSNGAPVRLAVPWKYGFKSGKSIVKIRLVEKQPVTSWVKIAPHEYGFYANVNPEVAHPRWSQATERRIGAGFFAPRVPTLMFNGYADQVASLYGGMDLARNY